MEEETNEQCQKYIVGDLLWAKIGHHPYWPCMVSYDPHEGSYCKKKKVRSTESIIYHVQYFGKQTQHGWTSPGSIFPFEGEQAYYATRRGLKKNATCPSVKKKIEAKYSIAPTVLEAWVIAVREAEAAMEYEIQERYESCVFKYDHNLKPSGSNKGAVKRIKSKGESSKSKKARVQEIYGPDQRFCKICNKGNVDLVCSGICMQYFHKECLGLIKTPEDFQCIYCEQGLSTCFVCKKADTSSIIKCSKCKYHYHEECFKKFPCSNTEKKICPYHVCLSCHNETRKNVSSKGPLINCIRCPTAFHASLQCMPVGSVKLSSTTMVCPEHFLGKNKVSPQIVSNVLYCSVCSEGGKLICCESCPNSYHINCLHNAEIPTDDFFCDDCVKRKYLYVGMIVWAKTGNFRWWPAQIMDVLKIPQNVRNRDNYDGEFPVQYFGTDEYFWTHRGRVIPYAEHHKDYCRTGSKQCRLDSYYKLSLDEASEAFDEYLIQRKMQLLEGQRFAYKHIKINRAIAPAQIAFSTGKSVLPCSCNPCKPFPCGSSSGCLNRSMLMECHPDVCLAGDRCDNQRFQRRTYARTKVFKTENRGWGLQSDQFIPKGTFVIEYVGEVITHEEYRRRLVEKQSKNEENYYFLYLDSRRMIDAGPQGNFSRFINHACSANCEMSKWSVNGDLRIGIFAIRDIHDGEELTFNYQFDSIQFEQKCYCGTAACEGFIGRNGKKKSK